VLFNESSGGEFIDLRPVNRVKAPIERVECFHVAKSRLFTAPIDQTIAAPLQFIVDEQHQEVDWP
jgi:hypothetical protein